MDDLYKIIHDPNKDIYQKLDEIVDTFWQWSKTIKHVFEWETRYQNWELLNTLFDKLIDTTTCYDWDQKTINNLLFIIGRDNECELLVSKLAEIPEYLLFLGQEGLSYPDADTKWQLAHYLSNIASIQLEAEEIILKYYEDQNEYVKRRALLALGIIKSRHAEQCALESWKTGMKYQKLAALEVLKQINSPQYSILAS
ncbi:HEAT repeat domain-containing protein [Paenibacillus favisporus]|uniref:HEAT repeat domain-containing protein n=1 Tax=Paenibacillus TaxID=44249 RepID=UPI0011AB5D5E|nr:MULTISPECIES: HEAT repeat domain-containing protein [Paenibacillus]MEC0174587.1 HEAT repeat domain-containing protein [Paenibacillus favisporus]